MHHQERQPLNCICSPDDKVGDDEHKHQCHKCGTTWRHKDNVADTCETFDEAHTCPSCGVEVTEKIMDEGEIWKQLMRIFRG